MFRNTAYGTKWGSPPRVRGKAARRTPDGRKPGITPACAGKSANVAESIKQYGDHPRVCGEKNFGTGAPSLAAGSPPRVRGKGYRHDEAAKRVGITPACAGKRHRCVSVIVHARDHPRVCGEKMTNSLAGQESLGSPPRVRGKVPAVSVICVCDGITPACAGKRLCMAGICKA